MKRVIVHPGAEAEILKAASWYEEQRQGLGDEFVQAVQDVLEAIQTFPGQFPIYRRNTRRAILRRFPYLLFYRELEHLIVVVACLHPRRSPKIWPE